MHTSYKAALRASKLRLGRCLMILLVSCCAASASAQRPQVSLSETYAKQEYQVEMRDGVQLHISVFSPRDRSRDYPIILKRTPYSCRPYGRDRFPRRIGPSPYMENEGYIFVHQDVRGRWMSEGTYDNMRPHVDGDAAIDESSDTYDTIEWLLKNIPGNNGKVGQWGISYPGFYSAASLPEHHPALVAVSPQAPIADFFFDDFHHQGAYTLMYWQATSVFGYQHNGPTFNPWYSTVNPSQSDAYQFYMDLGPLRNAAQYYGDDNFFWQQLVDHPNYDSFWQRRNILPHLKGIRANVLTVGGWFDAEDLYGPLQIYRAIEKNNPDTFNALVMGPWSHGDWARDADVQMVSAVSFGRRLSDAYQRDVEAPFFKHFLKGQGERPDFEALVFDTGNKAWRKFVQWPPRDVKAARMYLSDEGITSDPPLPKSRSFSSFVSDPANPVPYRDRENLKLRFTPRPYMAEDQRFATARNDVLSFSTNPLLEDFTLSGDIIAHLMVSTTGTDADWIVKLIDVYPSDHPTPPETPAGVSLAGYQQMVRSEAFRGRFRNSYEQPEPFIPGEITEVRVPLQDVFHTFKKGHRIMVHVQSTWFPLIDRNPQTYVDNIFRAREEDFQVQTHKLHHSPEHPSFLEIKVIRPGQQ